MQTWVKYFKKVFETQILLKNNIPYTTQDFKAEII